jgi:uroporphyrinogen decarboxylase
MLRNLRREGTPERVYYFEHGIADNVLDGLDARFGITRALDTSVTGYLHLKRRAIHRFLGHELFRVFPPGARMQAPRRDGAWAEEGRGAIASWADFEAFHWPDPASADLSVLDFYETHPVVNMRAFHVLDLWEVVRELFGFETFCYMLYEEPALIEAVFDRVGKFDEAIVRALCDYDGFGAVYLADDLGYKSGLMISPEQIRRLLLPWHRRLAALAHERGKLLLFHSCGQMYDLIDDYIGDVGIDAKHSFEDNVLPVTEAKRRYGARLSLLGGVDVDILARANEATIRARTREILDVCQSGGGYCLGSGNWVTDYVPIDNYLAMLDEARRWSG